MSCYPGMIKADLLEETPRFIGGKKKKKINPLEKRIVNAYKQNGEPD